MKMLFALFLSASATQVAQPMVIRDDIGAGVRDKGIILDVGEFDEKTINKVARDFLEESRNRTLLARLTIAANEQSLRRAYVHGGANTTYSGSIKEIEHSGYPTGPIARVMVLKDQAKISLLKNGALSESVLGSGSADPTIFEEDSHTYELLHFKLSKLGSASLPPKLYSLSLYLKASPDISIRSCVAILRRCYEMFKIADLTVFVRTDRWFLEDMHYPAVFPFAPMSAVPNELQYKAAAHVVCTFISGRPGNPTCSGFSFKD